MTTQICRNSTDGADGTYKACQDARESGLLKTPVQQISSSKWAMVTSFQFVYSLIVASMGIVVLPIEGERLHRGQHTSLWVGVYVSICGITQLICPIAGKLSDRLAHKHGRRRPCIALGGVFASFAFAAMSVASDRLASEMYIVCLFCANLALNVAFSAQCALPADLQENVTNAHDSKGIVSSFIGLYSFLGSLAAVGTIAVTMYTPVAIEYLFYVFFLLLTCSLVCCSVTEQPTTHLQFEPLTFKDVLKCYTVSMATDKNFFWVCVGRMCYYLSTSAVVFLYYYERDVFGIEEESIVKRRLAVVIVSALVIGAVITVPAANLSNRIGRKPVIYFACACVGAAFVGYMIVPAAHWMMPVSVALYGIGSGAYMSVDYALALHCLPESKNPAESFGLWGVAGFLGSSIGPMSGGLILYFNRSIAEGGDTYTVAGYRELMFLLGVCMNFLVVFFTYMIADVK